MVRHYTWLSQRNFGIDTGFYPLGSCTMKHNPRVNEAIAQMPGITDIHHCNRCITCKGSLPSITRCRRCCPSAQGWMRSPCNRRRELR